MEKNHLRKFSLLFALSLTFAIILTSCGQTNGTEGDHSPSSTLGGAASQALHLTAPMTGEILLRKRLQPQQNSMCDLVTTAHPLQCTSTTVSYTHLDVYKRQPFHDSGRNHFVKGLLTEWIGTAFYKAAFRCV